MRKLYLLFACCLGFFANAQNTINFTFSTNAAGNLVTFTNTSVLAADSLPKRAFWTFGDGYSQTTPPLSGTTHYYSNAGTYQACLKIYRYNPANLSDSTLLGAVCKSIVIEQRCEAAFQWTDSIAGSPSYHLVKFYGAANSNSGKPITQVCWSFGDGTDTCINATASAAPPLNITHRYTQNGNYNVCLKVKFDGGCVAEKCNTISLNNSAPPDSCTAAFTNTANNTAPLVRKFTARPWHNKGKKPVKICWAFGDGKDTCIQYTTSYTGDYIVEHRYAAYGNYQVCVTIKYDGGCEKKKCDTVSVTQPVPTLCSFDLAEAAVNAASLERKFYVGLMPNAVAEKICWSFGDGTDTCVLLSSPPNPQQLMITHRYTAPGNYAVCAKVTYAGGCVAQRCRQVSIVLQRSNVCGGYMTDSTLSANTIRFKGTGIQNASDYVVSYNWTFGDGTTGTGQVIDHNYTAPGRYNVCLYLKTNTGCETKICKAIGITGNSQPQLVLTPNPVINVLNATFTSLLQQTLTIRIYNANGLMVRSYVRPAIVGFNNWTFSDVGTLPTGVYSVIVQSANQFATAIFFKQ